ncbi:hypothetical protein DM01DRAFT_299683 [Hesseltinella vesiculosa]|uniref:Uncharacterized protein n=1 Tax=Hesseltinella vesiculosa TaxID=101127 RepID=A0A1X2GUJ5_9FUNG|nr:hypothetical protein DM01DRAFT_299683 [Hesseltinella vesiculosa]
MTWSTIRKVVLPSLLCCKMLTRKGVIARFLSSFGNSVPIMTCCISVTIYTFKVKSTRSWHHATIFHFVLYL